MLVGSYRWVIFILAYPCMLGFAFTLQSLQPILTLIVKELKLTHAEAGLLMSLFDCQPYFYRFWLACFLTVGDPLRLV